MDLEEMVVRELLQTSRALQHNLAVVVHQWGTSQVRFTEPQQVAAVFLPLTVQIQKEMRLPIQAEAVVEIMELPAEVQVVLVS
jgi:hypothetical protein